jgi:hypothetical protein
MKTSSGLMIILFLITLLINFHCINEPPTDTFFTVVKGIVTDSETDKPIEGVFVQAISYSPEENDPPYTYTNEEGFYSLSIKRSELIDMVRYEKEGYYFLNREITGKIKTNEDEVIELNTKLTLAGECPYIIGIDPDPPEVCYTFWHSYPAWSPCGRYIAYIRSDQNREGMVSLYIYDLQRNNESLVLDWPDNMTSQAWSPDGKWITFGMGKQIYKIRTDGSRLTNLSNNPEREYFFPAWSPVGNWIVYEDRTPIPHDEANYPDSYLKRGPWIMNSNGTNKQWYLRYAHHNTWNPAHPSQILSITSIGAYVIDRFLIWSPTNPAKDTLIVRDDAINMTPHYSPDGNRIVFYSQYNYKQDVNIWVINSDGRGLRRLTRNGGAFPAWSPDGNTIAYVNIDYFDGDGQIYLMNPKGSNRRPMRR